MKVSVLEPLGISNERLRRIMEDELGSAVSTTFYDTRSEDPATLVERAKGAECVVLSNIRFDRTVISQLPELKYICIAFTGMDLVDLDYCDSVGIKVRNCAGYSTEAVADLVLAFAIMLSRNLIPCNEVVRKEGTKAGLVGCELMGKRFGVIGAGAIGTRVLQLAQAFGCETVAYSRTRKEIDGVTFVSLEELLRTSDFVSLHVPQKKDTVGMIGREQLAKMKKTAFLINTARGPVVDTDALAEALNSGVIAGAAADVFDTEPPISRTNPLLLAKNLIATPHIGFATEEAFVKRAHIVCGNIRSWLKE